jgi:predicted RNase H-like HicB family nuclease
MAEYGYTVIFEELAEGGYQVIAPALPGIVIKDSSRQSFDDRARTL